MQLTRYHRGCTRTIAAGQIRRERAAYYGMITEVDALVGELVDALESTGQIDNTVVIFLADHGDMMGEHNFFHKNAPYDGCSLVPLIISGPGVPGNVTVDTPVSLVDVFPTIVDVVGGSCPDGVRGSSLLPLAEGNDAGHPFVYQELNTERLITGVFSIVQGDWKYNCYVDYPDQLFNLREDPGEWHDRSEDSECSETLARLREILFCLVDPERINDQAFADQNRRLNAFIGERTLEDVLREEQFLAHFSRRLGEDQARRVLTRHFQRRTCAT